MDRMPSADAVVYQSFTNLRFLFAASFIGI